MLDYEFAHLWIAVLSLGLSTCVAIYAWWVSRNRATAEVIEELKAQIRENEREMDRMQRDVVNLPTHRDMEGVRSELSGLRSDVSKLVGSMEPLSHLTKLMTEHMMNKGA